MSQALGCKNKMQENPIQGAVVQPPVLLTLEEHRALIVRVPFSKAFKHYFKN